MHESAPTHRHVMKELLDTERVYVEELLCVLEVRVGSSHDSPAQPARSCRPVGGMSSGRGRVDAGTAALGRVCRKREGLSPRDGGSGCGDALPRNLGRGRKGAGTEISHQNACVSFVPFVGDVPEFRNVERWQNGWKPHPQKKITDAACNSHFRACPSGMNSSRLDS